MRDREKEFKCMTACASAGAMLMGGLSIAASPVVAQQITGVPSSPSAII